MALWKNFFPELILSGISSQDSPFGYMEYGPPSGSLAVFSRRGLPCLRQVLYQTRERHHSTSSVMLAVPVDRSPLFSQRGGMFFHISPVTQFRLPIHWQNGFCARRCQKQPETCHVALASSIPQPVLARRKVQLEPAQCTPRQAQVQRARISGWWPLSCAWPLHHSA